VIAVIGAGVVGLAAGIALAGRGRPVCVLERHRRPGAETSTHNSGVIHAGLYHPPGSLKTQLCRDGAARLYHFCRAHGVPHVRCGKLVVAAEGEAADLDLLHAGARENGAAIERVDRAFVAAREPHVAAAGALWSPDTGWVDADALVRALTAELTRLGGILVAGTPVIALEPGPSGGITVITPRERIEADCCVNAAGLFADEISRMAGGAAFRIHPCRGEYAELAPRARHLVNGLVYPVPHASGHGLGVHLTKTAHGAVWIGPTIAFQESKTDYEGGRLPVEAFLAPTRAMLPSIAIDDLRLGGSGIRPKLHPPTERFADFLIGRDANCPALIHAAGIDSPGLTACLAIGERVAALAVR
jgi:L-2-hydroxyglutarate oxidase LhgO